MELVVLLAMLFAVSKIFGAARNKGQTTRPPGALPGQEPEGPDLLRELRKALEEMKGRPPGSVPAREEFLPVALVEEVGGRRSGVVSLEDPPARPERVMVDYDDQAEAVIKRRLKWVDDHAGALTAADHRAFDAKIRAKPKVSKPVGADRTATMRHLFVWHEVFGKPVSLRDLDR